MEVIDSHTEGEPTRLVVAGGPDLGRGSVARQAGRLAQDFDALRRFIVCEPRGHEAMVGALLCETAERDCAAGLIFFNTTGLLGMCGHATIGAAVSLHHMGRLALGQHSFETPVGKVAVTLKDANSVEIENVPAYRHRKDVKLEVRGLGPVTGDVAWGGNWFFLCKDAPAAITPENIPALMQASQALRAALTAAGITGAEGASIDHVEFFGAPGAAEAHSRNFVLCPGSAFDRSPCGTGTSAKLACLAADGALKAGDTWVQEGIMGGRFRGRYREAGDGRIIPMIEGRAFVTGTATLLRDPADPFPHGFSAAA